MEDPNIIYIAGSGRSGSTLLDLLLGQLDGVTSVGEFHRLNWYARDNHETCTCGEPVASCPFWTRVSEVVSRGRGDAACNALETDEVSLYVDDLSKVRDGIEKAAMLSGVGWIGRLGMRLAAPQHVRAIRQSLDWYSAVARVSGSTCVVDSTKDSRRMKALCLWLGEKMIVVRLLRDGRAICASAMRRTGIDMRAAAEEWKRTISRVDVALRGVEASSIVTVRYEDLCLTPESEIGKICVRCGVPFDPDSFGTLNKPESHNIGGNPMRFRHDERKIVADERWRSELTIHDLREFKAVAGEINSTLGYEE